MTEFFEPKSTERMIMMPKSRYTAEIEMLNAENDRLRKAIQDFLDGDWGERLRKIDKCKHGRYGYEDCIGCIDEYFAGVLANGQDQSPP